MMARAGRLPLSLFAMSSRAIPRQIRTRFYFEPPLIRRRRRRRLMLLLTLFCAAKVFCRIRRYRMFHWRSAPTAARSGLLRYVMSVGTPRMSGRSERDHRDEY